MVLTPKRIPPSICVRDIIAESDADKATVLLCVRFKFNPTPKFETKCTIIGFVQGKIVSELFEVSPTQSTIVQDGDRMHVPSAFDLAMAASNAMHVSSG